MPPQQPRGRSFNYKTKYIFFFLLPVQERVPASRDARQVSNHLLNNAEQELKIDVKLDFL